MALQAKKAELAAHIKDVTGYEVSTNSMFDIHVRTIQYSMAPGLCCTAAGVFRAAAGLCAQWQRACAPARRRAVRTPQRESASIVCVAESNHILTATAPPTAL